MNTIWTGRHVFWTLIGLFALVVLVNGIMIGVAVFTFAGVETAGAYQRGIGFNRQLAEAQRQADLGWVIETDLAPGDGGSRQLTVTATDAAGAPVSLAIVAARFGRRVTDAEDRDLAFAAAGPNTFVADLGNAAPGNWQLQLTAEGPDGQSIELRRDLWLK